MEVSKSHRTNSDFAIKSRRVLGKYVNKSTKTTRVQRNPTRTPNSYSAHTSNLLVEKTLRDLQTYKNL
jgi:hypothetical protein